MWTGGYCLVRHLFAALACLSLGLGACEDVTPARAVMVTDSAGVRITVNRDEPRSFADIDSVPVLSLGGADAVGPTEFSRIQHVYRDPRGRLWVADGQSGEMRIFNPDGSHWKTRGGRGEGPGEFLRIRMLGPLRGDSVAVWDVGNARLTLFDPEGEFVRTSRLTSRETFTPRAVDIFWDGSILAQVPQIISVASIEPGAILGDTVLQIRIDLEDSTEEPQLKVPGGTLWLWTGRSQIPIPFTTALSFDLVDEAVHLATGPDFRVQVFEDGRLAEIYGVARDEREVSVADIAVYRDFVEEYIPKAQQSDYLSALDHPSRPNVLPAYSRLLSASDGHVWAQIYSPDVLAPATWDVFNGAREWVGQVQTPANFAAMSITDGTVAGVWRDDVGVEHVRIYRIQPG